MPCGRVRRPAVPFAILVWWYTYNVINDILKGMRTSKRMVIPEKDRIELESIVRNGKTPQKLARRARIILLSALGVPTGQIVHNLARPFQPSLVGGLATRQMGSKGCSMTVVVRAVKSRLKAAKCGKWWNALWKRSRLMPLTGVHGVWLPKLAWVRRVSNESGKRMDWSLI